jgi:hypothetical protein
VKLRGPERTANCSEGMAGGTFEVLNNRYRPSRLTNGSMAEAV